MPFIRFRTLPLLLSTAAVLAAFSDLSSEQLKLLQDPGGWEYLKMSSNGGIQTQYPCFDGKLHPGACSGRLTLSTDKKFTQQVTINGEGVARHGTYTLEGDQLTLFDELGTRDGPFTITLDALKEVLVMQMSQVRIDLVSAKSLRKKKGKETK